MKYFLFVLIMLVTAGAFAQQLTLKGELAGLNENTKVILSDLMRQKFHDTATVSNNSFEFNCKLPGAGIYVLRVGLVGQKPEHRIFYFDTGTVRLTGERGSLKNAVIYSEDLYMKDYLLFQDNMKGQPIFVRQKLLADSVIMRSGETGSYVGALAQPGLIDRFLAADKEADEKRIQLAKEWLLAHPKSDINAYIIYTYLRTSLDETELKKSIAKLSATAKKSLPVKIMMNPKR